jgi:hypothetical protein
MRLPVLLRILVGSNSPSNLVRCFVWLPFFGIISFLSVVCHLVFLSILHLLLMRLFHRQFWESSPQILLPFVSLLYHLSNMSFKLIKWLCCALFPLVELDVSCGSPLLEPLSFYRIVSGCCFHFYALVCPLEVCWEPQSIFCLQLEPYLINLRDDHHDHSARENWGENASCSQSPRRYFLRKKWT